MSESTDIDEELRAIERSKSNVCDGDCGFHEGKALAFHVTDKDKDWGWYSYCEVAKECDESVGFVLTPSLNQE